MFFKSFWWRGLSEVIVLFLTFSFFFSGIHNLDIWWKLSMIWLSFVSKRLTSRAMAYVINKATFLSPHYQRLTSWHLAFLNYFLDFFYKKSTVLFVLLYKLLLSQFERDSSFCSSDLQEFFSRHTWFVSFFRFPSPAITVCDSQFIKSNAIITSEPVGRRALSWPFWHVKVRQRILLTIRSVFSASSRTSSILSVNK